MEKTELLRDIRALRSDLRDYTKAKYNRVNPFCEDIFDWKEKGKFCGGKDVTVYDSTTIIGDVQIGDKTWIGPFCMLDGSGSLKIGRNCSISTGVQILTHDTVKWALSGGKCGYEYGSSTIGDCCFIGTNSVILKDVKIGNHCLVGANSFVNKSFEDFAIIIGSPAKKVGRVEFEGDDVNLKYFKV